LEEVDMIKPNPFDDLSDLEGNPAMQKAAETQEEKAARKQSLRENLLSAKTLEEQQALREDFLSLNGFAEWEIRLLHETDDCRVKYLDKHFLTSDECKKLLRLL
jgi:hypothetical protein